MAKACTSDRLSSLNMGTYGQLMLIELQFFCSTSPFMHNYSLVLRL